MTRLSFCAAMLSLVTLSGRASGSTPLRLDEVLDAVRERHPSALAAEAGRIVAEGELQSARGGFDPTLRLRLAGAPFGNYEQLRFDAWIEQPIPLWGLSLFAGYRLGIGKFAVYDGKLETNRAGEIRGGVLIPLLRGGPFDRRRAALGRAKIGRTIADIAVAEQALELIRTAGQRYWDWVAAGRKREVARALMQIARDRQRAIELRVTRGDLPSIENAENGRALAMREQQLVAAERAVEQAAIALSLYLRDGDGATVIADPARLPPSLPEPRAVDRTRVEDDVRLAGERRPEVARLLLVRDQASLDVRLAKAELLPALDATVGVSYDLGEGPAYRARPDVEAGLFFELPIPNRAARGKVASARAAVRRVEHQLQLARDRVAIEVRDAASALRAAEARLVAARRELRAAEEVERGERQRFDLGDSTLLIVNLREQATSEAAAREIDALADWQRAAILYHAATGALLTEGT